MSGLYAYSCALYLHQCATSVRALMQGSGANCNRSSAQYLYLRSFQRAALARMHESGVQKG
eukprot:7453808-Pyramimonas_sp.AAC.1